MGSRVSWFPGHMASALASLNRIIKGVDLVLEVRDARVPFSSANPKLSSLLQGKRHIVVLNKADLVDPWQKRETLRSLQQQGLLAMPAISSNPASVKKLLDTAIGWIERERAQSQLSILMVVGLPNSGKSSIINALKASARQAGVLGGEQAFQKTAHAGPTPGLTRQINGFQVCNQPLTYVLDTPGIMMPAVPSDEVGLKLALAGAIKDSIVGEEAAVRYLVHLLANNQQCRAALAKACHSGGAGSSRGSSGRAMGISSSAQRKLHNKLQQIQRAVLAAASHGCANAGHVGTPSAAAMQQRQHHHPVDVLQSSSSVDQYFPGDAPMWHPGLEDDADGFGQCMDSLRLDMLLQQLGVAGAADPSQQLGWYVRILQAFRTGGLGKWRAEHLTGSFKAVSLLSAMHRFVYICCQVHDLA
eukprot:gene4201-4449_t